MILPVPSSGVQCSWYSSYYFGHFPSDWENCYYKLHMFVYSDDYLLQASADWAPAETWRLSPGSSNNSSRPPIWTSSLRFRIKLMINIHFCVLSPGMMIEKYIFSKTVDILGMQRLLIYYHNSDQIFLLPRTLVFFPIKFFLHVLN